MITRLRITMPRPRRPAGAARPAGRRPARIRCEKDEWSFDPRYTQGRCPICGWAPEGAPNAPGWMTLVNRIDWPLTGLVLLADVLILLALIAGSAAGLWPAHR